MTRREVVRNVKLYLLLAALLMATGIAAGATEREVGYRHQQSSRTARAWSSACIKPCGSCGETQNRPAHALHGTQKISIQGQLCRRDDGHAELFGSGGGTQTRSTEAPLPQALMDNLYAACESYSVPVSLALAVIEQESGFNLQAVSSAGCYGLMQLNPDYFPAGLTPEENIWCGVRYLGELLAAHDTVESAVTAYFYGPSDRVHSWYSDEVLARVDRWK